MDQIITLILECVVIYVLVKLVLTVFAVSREYKRIQAESQVKEPEGIEITIEVHGEVAYFFNKNTNEFIAQGSNAEEFVTHIKDRKYTDVKFLIDNKELAKVAWLDDVFKAHRVEA